MAPELLGDERAGGGKVRGGGGGRGAPGEARIRGELGVVISVQLARLSTQLLPPGLLQLQRCRKPRRAGGVVAATDLRCGGVEWRMRRWSGVGSEQADWIDERRRKAGRGWEGSRREVARV